MKNLKILSAGIVMLILFSSQSALSHNAPHSKKPRMITGVVQDQAGVPLPAARVFVLESKTGSQTDLDGYYSIEAKRGQTLVFSCDGKKECRIPVWDNNIIDITLYDISPVSLIGCGVKKDKRILCYSSTVNSRDPLYVIDGRSYTEAQISGPNATSPYAPLNMQEIETVTILKDEEATRLYGAPGRNGVILITTKNRKPAVRGAYKGK